MSVVVTLHNSCNRLSQRNDVINKHIRPKTKHDRFNLHCLTAANPSVKESSSVIGLNVEAVYRRGFDERLFCGWVCVWAVASSTAAGWRWIPARLACRSSRYLVSTDFLAVRRPHSRSLYRPASQASDAWMVSTSDWRDSGYCTDQSVLYYDTVQHLRPILTPVVFLSRVTGACTRIIQYSPLLDR